MATSRHAGSFIVILSSLMSCTLTCGNNLNQWNTIFQTTNPWLHPVLPRKISSSSTSKAAQPSPSSSSTYFSHSLPDHSPRNIKATTDTTLKEDNYFDTHNIKQEFVLERPKKIKKSETCCKHLKATGPIGEKSTDKPVSCKHVSGYHNHKLLKMVTSCPRRWTNETTRHHCHTWDHVRFKDGVNKMILQPVQDRRGTVYANVFCAICHDVGTVYPWTVSLSCDSSTTFGSKNSDNEQFSSGFVTLDFSDISILNKFTETASCHSKIIPAFPDAVQGCRHDRHLFPFSFRRRVIPFQYEYRETQSPEVSFNLLLNFDFKGESHILFSSSQKIVKTEYIRLGRCDEGETYDTFHSLCRPVKCNKPFYRLMGNSCVLNERFSSESNSFLNSPFFDEIAVMSLSINITLESQIVLSNLKNLNEIVRQQLAETIEISEDRIQHMNVTFDFQTTNGTRAQIHRLDQLTPELKRKMHIEGWDQLNLSPDRYQQMSYESGRGSDEIKQFGNKGDKVVGISEDDSKTHDVINSVSKKTGPGKEKKEYIGNGNEEIGSNFKDIGVNGKSTLKSDKEKSEFGYNDNVNTSTENPNNTSPFHKFGISKIIELLSIPMTMYISFIIVPAQHPKLADESTPVLVNKISHLIRTNSMKISLKGEQFKVSGLHNTVDDANDQDEFCPWGRLQPLLGNNKFQLIEINGTRYLHATEEDRYYEQGLFNAYAIAMGKNSAKKTSFTYFEQFSIVCIMPRITHADCRRIELMAHEYEMKLNNSIIFQEKEYNMSMYTVQNATSGLVEICVPQSYDSDTHIVSPRIIFIDNECGTKFADIRRVEGYLTMILGRMSTIALALVFITYCLFPSLRTLPGCNIMNLTLALLIAESVFMQEIFIQDDNLCTAVTIILHFFFLVAHFWMNVISYDVHRTFCKRQPVVVSRQDSVGKKSAYFPRYFAYAWGMPLIIVSTCIFMEYSDLFDVDISYKKGQQNPNLHLVSTFHTNTSYSIHNVSVEDRHEKNISQAGDFSELQYKQICWIQKPVVALLAFGAPVLLIFLLNCVFFAKTILSVSRTVKMTRENLNRQESSSSIGKGSGRSEAMLYLRMSTVMGITWVFGFSSAIISSLARPISFTICTLVYVNSILFTIFNISQGIFIFVAFLCNRRVMQLYRRLFVRLRRVYVRKSHTSTVYSISSARDIS